jgi:excisionase family DNA binding protein
MAEITVEELALRLGVSADTVRRRLRKGELPGHRTEDGRWVAEVTDLADDTPTPSAGTSVQTTRLSEVLRADLQAEVERLQAENVQLRARLEDAQHHEDHLLSTIEAQRQQAATLQQQVETQTQANIAAESELRQLLAREQQAHAEARLMLQNLLPKLPAPGEAETQEKRKPWWRWWG